MQDVLALLFLLVFKDLRDKIQSASASSQADIVEAFFANG